MSTASERLNLWVSPPPRKTAFFSNRLNPGVVLRVAAMRARPPAHNTHSRVTVDMPLMRAMKFRTSLSDCRIFLALPHTVITVLVAGTNSPSSKSRSASRPKYSKISSASASPEMMQSSLAMMTARAGVSGTRLLESSHSPKSSPTNRSSSDLSIPQGF